MTTKKRTVLISLAATFFASVWGGAYTLHLITNDDWRVGPILLTMTILCMVSIFGAIHAGIEMK